MSSAANGARQIRPTEPSVVDEPFQKTLKDEFALIEATLTQPISNTNTTRIPSPLLYHKRSQAASSEPIVHDATLFTAPSQRIDKYNRRHADLAMEQFTMIPQARLLPESNEAPDISFVAAKLPIMGGTSWNDECSNELTSEPEVPPVLPNNCQSCPATGIPPVMTTTNAYIFPKKVYNIYCRPNVAWSGSSYSDMAHSKGTQQSLVFPKLHIPGRKSCFRSNTLLSDAVEGKPVVVNQQTPLVDRYSAWSKTSLPAPLPQLFDSRCRSSTQDSFDYKFNVDTAVRQVEAVPIDRPFNPRQLPNSSDSAEVISSSASGTKSINVVGSHTGCDLWTESPASLSQTSLDETNNNTTVHGQNDYEETSSQQFQEVWSKYFLPELKHNDDNGENDHGLNEGAARTQDTWSWDDEEWGTASSTSTGECNHQSGFDEDVWAW